MTVKTKFAILNLVKSFLTSITFDNLSERIKNLRLVINLNLFTKEDIQMKNIKTILITALSLLLLFSVSCKNDDKTGSGGDDTPSGYTHSNHPPAGEYKYFNHNTNNSSTNETATVKIVDGNCNITGRVQNYRDSSGLDYNITVTSWYTRSDIPTINRAGNSVENSGEATVSIPNPSSIPLESLNVVYNTTNESISVSFRTVSDNKSYSALELTRN